MKYIYIFKKQNGEIFFEEEAIAYKHIFQSENYREKFQYLGRIDSNDYLSTMPETQDKVAEFKKKLLDETPELKKALENGARSGAFTQLEANYAKKVNDYSIQVEKERTEAFLPLAKMEYPDKNLNISTPGGSRDLIINALR